LKLEASLARRSSPRFLFVSRRKKNMNRYAPPLLALAGWIPAGAYSHPGNHPHAHPHLELYIIVLLLAVVAGIAWGVVRHARRNKRPPSE
jgi:hypothetical protein